MLENEYRILAINPGSTSTRIGIFDHEISLFETTIFHDRDRLERYDQLIDQHEFRKRAVLETLDTEGINLSKIRAVCGRGGLLRPIEGGTYIVNEAMLHDLRLGYAGEHASNLGGIIAYDIAQGLNIPAFIVDPVVVDELDSLARVTGLPPIQRKSIFHALNQKAVARRVAIELGKKYASANFIVVHMGGGITVGVHRQGRVVDVNNGLDGDGPLSPERAGTVPAGDLIELCYSGRFTKDEMLKKIVGHGGLAGLLGTNDIINVQKMIENGNEYAKFIYRAMGYQVAKEIGAAGTVLSGKVDAIIITGRLAYGTELLQDIIERVNWIADVVVRPEVNELQSLAEGALRVLRGDEEAKVYPGLTDSKTPTFKV